MINKNIIKIKSEEQEIPFANLLVGVVAETVVEIISNGAYCNELYLNNGMELSSSNYKKSVVSKLYYQFARDLDEKMAFLYLRDICKAVATELEKEGFETKATVENQQIKLSLYIDSMYVPIILFFEKKLNNQNEGIVETITKSLDGNVIKYLTSPKEDIVVNHIFEIVNLLELINDMDHYYDLFEILTKYPVNGRRVKEKLQAKLLNSNIAINESRINALKSYESYTYMKKKWKVELRQKKTSQPEWKDVIICLNNFIGPIWEAMENNVVFLGDWMPQLKRFLD